MPYVENQDGSHYLDENGNKIEYTVTYGDNVINYIHKESIYIDSEGHFDSEDRHIKIKDGIKTNHAVSKLQLDTLEQNTKNAIISASNTLKSEIQTMIQTAITTVINNLKTEMMTRIPKEITLESDASDSE